MSSSGSAAKAQKLFEVGEPFHVAQSTPKYCSLVTASLLMVFISKSAQVAYLGEELSSDVEGRWATSGAAQMTPTRELFRSLSAGLSMLGSWLIIRWAIKQMDPNKQAKKNVSAGPCWQTE